MNKKKKVEQMDLISNLPDHLIVRIISLLPTQEAVRTCILSMRWKYLWKGIDRIRLMGYESDPAKFRFLVEHILNNCNTTNLLSFVLFCPSTISLSRLNSWIRKAIGTKIQKLTLSVDTLFPGLPALSVLPQCVLASNTLVSLKLDSFFDIRVPDSILCFPYLKSLELDLLLPDQCNVMHRLLSSSPVLEQLFVNGHLDSSDFTRFDICVPSLLKLSLHLEYQGDGDDEDDTSEYVITIDTPKLRYLSIMDDSLSQYVVKNLVCVHKAEIMYQAVCLEALEPKHVNILFELLKGVSAAEVLALHSFTSDVLGSALGLTWPLFPNLKMLEVDLHDLSGWTCFTRLLHTVPNLKVLILGLDAMNIRDDDDERPQFQWSPPETVPVCLLEHIQLIAIKCFVGQEDELQAVEYLLNNSRVLNRMLIGFDPNPVDEDVVKKVLVFPRASKLSQVEVYNHVICKTNRSNNNLNNIMAYGI